MGEAANNTIVIDPVTRIEGHAKITLHLNEQGRVDDARFHVTQFRGFEKFAEGRPFAEMPALMARICGICPVSHLIASAKACDALMAVRIPPTADKLRRIFGLAQVVQSHALSFFYLSSPDLLLGLDADPATSNLFGVFERKPELARDGIRLRQFGQQIIERLGGKRIHPAWVVPGGVSEPLSALNRDAILSGIPEVLGIDERTLEWFKGVIERFREEIASFGTFPTLFLGIVKKDGGLTFYDGVIRIVNSAGDVIANGLDPAEYPDYIGEKVESWTYLKSPYYVPKGYPDGIYRALPLARINIADRCGTPRADQELAEFHEIQRTAVLSSYHYHHARLIEILYCLERMEQLLTDPEILSRHERATAGTNQLEGVGCCEAPRGTLIHHYRIDEEGLIRWVNLIIATGHNNLARNRGVLQVAKHFVRGENLSRGMLNRVEALIRAYDPCLSCSTHAVGTMPLWFSCSITRVCCWTSFAGDPELEVAMPHVLVIGYGNPLRGDDGLGRAVAAELLRENNSPEVEVLPCHQLTPELASAMSGAEAVIFVDCACEGTPGAFRCIEVQPEAGSATFTHDLTPSTLLSLTCELFGVCPHAYLLSICGCCFDTAESLSSAVTGALPELKEVPSELIHRHLACCSVQ